MLWVKWICSLVLVDMHRYYKYLHLQSCQLNVVEEKKVHFLYRSKNNIKWKLKYMHLNTFKNTFCYKKTIHLSTSPINMNLTMSLERNSWYHQCHRIWSSRRPWMSVGYKISCQYAEQSVRLKTKIVHLMIKLHEKSVDHQQGFILIMNVCTKCQGNLSNNQ